MFHLSRIFSLPLLLVGGQLNVRLIWSLQTLRGGVYEERSSNGVSKYSLKPLTSTPSLVVTTLPSQAHHLVDTWYQDHGTTHSYRHTRP